MGPLGKEGESRDCMKYMIKIEFPEKMGLEEKCQP